MKYNSYNPKYEPTETKYQGGDFKRSRGLSLSSKMRVLRYSQTIHIKHAKTIFHMIDMCFPIQFLQAKRRELHTIRHEKTCSEVVDDPQIPQIYAWFLYFHCCLVSFSLLPLRAVQVCIVLSIFKEVYYLKKINKTTPNFRDNYENYK